MKPTRTFRAPAQSWDSEAASSSKWGAVTMAEPPDAMKNTVDSFSWQERHNGKRAWEGGSKGKVSQQAGVEYGMSSYAL